MKRDIQLLDDVLKSQDFFGRVLRDSLDDWTLAKELGDYLVQKVPDLLIGYLVQARAYRHLGDWESATKAVKNARAVIASGCKEQLLIEDLEKDEMLLSSRA